MLAVADILLELHEQTVSMFLEQRGEYVSESEAFRAIAPKNGCYTDTLRSWLRQHERDTGGGSADQVTFTPSILL